MRILKQIWCSLAHRRHWYFYGYGDWRIQVCERCGDRWVVMAHAAKGERKEPTDDQPIHYQHGFGPGDGPSKVIEGESK